jgi:hypothetical protein
VGVRVWTAESPKIDEPIVVPHQRSLGELSVGAHDAYETIVLAEAVKLRVGLAIWGNGQDLQLAPWRTCHTEGRDSEQEDGGDAAMHV